MQPSRSRTPSPWQRSGHWQPPRVRRPHVPAAHGSLERRVGSSWLSPFRRGSSHLAVGDVSVPHDVPSHHATTLSAAHVCASSGLVGPGARAGRQASMPSARMQQGARTEACECGSRARAYLRKGVAFSHANTPSSSQDMGACLPVGPNFVIYGLYAVWAILIEDGHRTLGDTVGYLDFANVLAPSSWG